MVLHVFVEHHYPGGSETERDVRKLAIIYLKGHFLKDFIVVLPFSKIFKALITPEIDRMLYFIKVLRLSKAFWLLDHKTFTK